MRNPLLVDYWFVPRTVPPAFWREVVGGSPVSVPALRSAPVASRAGEVRWEIRAWGRRSWDATVEAPAGPLLIRQLWFPGFRVRVNGTETPARADPATGLLSVDVSAGRHDVAWRWEPFAPLTAARLVSAACAALAVLLLLLPRFARARRA
jgi:hypothetical protein